MQFLLIFACTAAAIVLICYTLLRVFFYRFMGPCHGDMEKDLKKFEEKLSETPLADKIPELREGRLWVRQKPHEDLYLTSADGVRLHARFYASPSHTDTTIVLCHGWRSRGDHDFGCICPWYSGRGYNILIIDQRAHGKSQGRYITFGAFEKYDIRDWCNLMASRDPDEKILLGGISMGCASALLAAQLPDMTPRLRGVIADCGYSNAYDELHYVLSPADHLWQRILLRSTVDLCRRKAGWDPHDVDTVKNINGIKASVLFIHGQKDNFVPCSSSEKNFEAFHGKKILLTVPGAGHGMSWLTDEPRCKKVLSEFLDSVQTVEDKR